MIEDANEHDHFAVAVLKDDDIMSQVPCTLPRILRHDVSINCEVWLWARNSLLLHHNWETHQAS